MTQPYKENGQIVKCYFCGKTVEADSSGERITEGTWLNINSGACGEFVCAGCNTDDNIRYDDKANLYFDNKHPHFKDLPKKPTVVELTREQAIEQLIENDVDLLTGYDNYIYLETVLMQGLRGYKDYTNEELIDDWENNIGDGQQLIIKN